MSSPTIDAGRLWSDLMTLGQIGALPRGGCDRLALTDADRDGRALFAFWCQEAGLAVTVDGMGNMFARREGTDPSLPPVFAGSHLDTQSPGGRFDGAAGGAGRAGRHSRHRCGRGRASPVDRGGELDQ